MTAVKWAICSVPLTKRRKDKGIQMRRAKGKKERRPTIVVPTIGYIRPRNMACAYCGYVVASLKSQRYAVSARPTKAKTRFIRVSESASWRRYCSRCSRDWGTPSKRVALIF